jgi:hypothetical protein
MYRLMSSLGRTCVDLLVYCRWMLESGMREVFAEPHTLINESGSYSGRFFFEFSNTFILKT